MPEDNFTSNVFGAIRVQRDPIFGCKLGGDVLAVERTVIFDTCACQRRNQSWVSAVAVVQVVVVGKLVPFRFAQALDDVNIVGGRLAFVDVHSLAVGSGVVLVAAESARRIVDVSEVSHGTALLYCALYLPAIGVVC